MTRYFPVYCTARQVRSVDKKHSHKSTYGSPSGLYGGNAVIMVAATTVMLMANGEKSAHFCVLSSFLLITLYSYQAPFGRHAPQPVKVILLHTTTYYVLLSLSAESHPSTPYAISTTPIAWIFLRSSTRICSMLLGARGGERGGREEREGGGEGRLAAAATAALIPPTTILTTTHYIHYCAAPEITRNRIALSLLSPLCRWPREEGGSPFSPNIQI